MGTIAKTGRNQPSLGERQPIWRAEQSRGAHPPSLDGVTQRLGRFLEKQAVALRLSRHTPQDTKGQVDLLRRRVIAARLAGA
jgi:hypothetical protein